MATDQKTIQLLAAVGVMLAFALAEAFAGRLFPREATRQHKPERFSPHRWLPLPRCSSANAWHFLLQRNEDQHRK